MKVTLERLPESRVQLDIEVDDERLEKSLESAYKRLSQKARIPGFRPGKAPRHMIERAYGREGLIREALDRLVPDVYNEMIEQEDVPAIAQPELEILELEPVRFKATVAVRPTVDLGDYRSIRVERQPVEVTDEQVEETVMTLRRRFAERETVERPAAYGDVLTVDVEGMIKGQPAEGDNEATLDEPFVQDTDAEFQLKEGQDLLVPGLAEAFVGMSAGDVKTIDMTIPDDFRVERFQGKAASFTLTVKLVEEEKLPEEDAELAAKVNAEDFKSFTEVRARIREDIEKALVEQEDTRVRNEAIDKLLEIATLDFPRVMVEREIDHMVSDAMGNDRQQYASYLSRIGRSEEEFRETWREAAELRVRRALILGTLGDEERIDPTDADVEAELDRIAAPMGEEAGRFRELFMTPDGIATIRRNLQSQQTLERLSAIVAGDGHDNPVAGATETAATNDDPGENVPTTEEERA
ncbi:MAG: trigger factor [Dehalococcoidia bacterium]